MAHDTQKALNMKLIICIFEQLSGMEINFCKSEIFSFGRAKKQENQYKELFSCEYGSFPSRYLGIPIHFRKLIRIVSGSYQKIDYLVLLNSVLTGLLMSMLSIFEMPKGV